MTIPTHQDAPDHAGVSPEVTLENLVPGDSHEDSPRNVSPQVEFTPDSTSRGDQPAESAVTPTDSEKPVRKNRFVLPVFEGPLDLLLHLVKVHEMDIYDIQISEITSQYMAKLEDFRSLNLEIAGDFLVMAATLLNIKSRSLLPRRDEEVESAEEEIDEILSTQDLIRKLVEFRKFKEISQSLKHLELENLGIFYRAQVINIVPGSEEELPRQDIRQLYEAFSKVLKQVRKKPQHQIMRERFTTEEKLLELRESIRTNETVNLSRVFERCVEKEEVITYFLAVLELSKLREITIAQADTYEDILIAAWDEHVRNVG